jgi:hypothetical protein
MGYRVIQWATGNVGKEAVRGIIAHPELELVGCWVHSDSKNGVDVGSICGEDLTGVAATTSVDELLGLEADCVVYTPLMANQDEVLSILRSGKNVVTPLGWFYPKSAPGSDAIDQACRDHGVSLHGTGIHPGGITERLPLTVASMSRNITHVRAEEFSDIRSYGAEFVVKEIMLFGKDPSVARDSAMLDLLGRGFLQSVDMVADALGFALDTDKVATHEMAVATAPIETPFGPLVPGTVAAQRFSWQATVGGTPVVTARVNWLMGQENLDPAWSFGEAGERFEIEVQGEPDVALTFHGLHPSDAAAGLERNPGLMATAMNCVSAVPYVVDAAPGIRTYLDLPLVTGRARRDLGVDDGR